jgi:hypothetical protein
MTKTVKIEQNIHGGVGKIDTYTCLDSEVSELSLTSWPILHGGSGTELQLPNLLQENRRLHANKGIIQSHE